MDRHLQKIKKLLSTPNTKTILLQATLWEKFAKVSPLIIILSITISYLLGERYWGLAKDIFIIMGITFAVFWWFWVIYTIAVICQILDKSQHGLKDIIIDLRDVHKEISNIRKEG
jgi:hypothetical protein